MPVRGRLGRLTLQRSTLGRLRLGRPLSLKARLVAALIGLLAVVCVVVGVVTGLALRQFLVQRLDNQLTAAGNRSATFEQHAYGGDRDGDNLPPPPSGRQDRGGVGFLRAPGQGAGTLGARVVDGQLTWVAVIDRDGDVQYLNPAGGAALTGVPSDGRPHSVDVGPFGDFRLLAQRAPDGDVLVTGLPLNGIRLTLLRLAAVEGAVALAALVTAGVVGASIVRHTLRPLDRVAATAGRVATLPLDRGEVALAERVPEADTDPRTEAGRVGAALNSLLNHVAAALTARQASETRVRQFVADASHELRTPLAAIRGYAELTRRSGAAAPPEVAYALGRVESEAARMSTLVDDLLLLARLDAGRPLARDEVDLVPLVVHAVSDAHVAGPQHRWQLDLPDEEVRIAGDQARLHQVVTNLLANARVHTPPGTTVTVRVRQEKDLVRLCVSDTGPGIPPKLLPSVFQRFARADESRSRTAGSTGLGLAIVSAVVHAHGGEVDVASEPGRTTFTVTLPALAAAHGSPTAPTGGRHSDAVESRDDSDSSRQEGPESCPVTPDSTERSVSGASVR